MIVGIDLGTTNSLVAVWIDGQARIIPNALGQNMTPSVVSLDDNGEFLIGLAARERLLTHPWQTAACFKRYMGTKRAVRLGDREYRPEELSSFVLRSLKADAEAFLNERIDAAVITVPAYFSDAQRKATRAAGELAGLKVERLLNEPTAAALAYGLHYRDVESKFLVLDLGGGTFDVSALELYEGVMEVRASAGDNFLGGEDFVACLIDAFFNAVSSNADLQRKREQPVLKALVHDQAEKVKRRLSEADSATMSINWEDNNYSWTVTTEQFAQICEPLLQRLRLPVERALRDARIPAAKLNEIILAGGATKKPVIRRMVAKLFGRLPGSHVNPEEVVALGAAVQAGLMMHDQALHELVLTDVCPYTLGAEVAELLSSKHYLPGYFLPIIERNTVIPCSRSQVLNTVVDNQTIVAIEIYQGESRFVKDNIFLGKLEVSVPPNRAQAEQVEVRFTYDMSGLLEVEATVLSTGAKHTLVIEEAPGTLTKNEIALRLEELSALKIPPRENAQNRVLLARLNRVYEESLGDKRSQVGNIIVRFETVLERQDPNEIEAVREELTFALNQLDLDPYL